MEKPLLSPKQPTPVSSTQRFLNPEPSEEPIIKPLKSKKAGNCINASDPRQSTELNSSSLQVSTQQSLNFKKSFSVTSPKRSMPATPLLLANKLKEIQGQSMTMKPGDDLRDLEEESRLKTEEPEKMLNSPKTEKFFELFKGETEAELNLEDFHAEVPHLRWCAFCKAEVATEFEFINTNKTFWSSVGIFFAGGVLGCFMLPYMTNYCKGVKVVCHACRRPLG